MTEQHTPAATLQFLKIASFTLLLMAVFTVASFNQLNNDLGRLTKTVEANEIAVSQVLANAEEILRLVEEKCGKTGGDKLTSNLTSPQSPKTEN